MIPLHPGGLQNGSHPIEGPVVQYGESQSFHENPCGLTKQEGTVSSFQ